MKQDTKYQEYLNSEKWKRIAKQRLEIDGYCCVVCGAVGTTGNPLEIHHLSYKHLYEEENRVFEDLVTLCHACHKSVHALMNRVTSKDGRRGWSDNRNIPKISVVSIGGSKEVGTI